MNSGSATDTSKLDAYLVKKKRCERVCKFFSESIPIVSVGSVLTVSCLQSPKALLLSGNIIMNIADSSSATIDAARVAHAERRSSIPGLSPLRW